MQDLYQFSARWPLCKKSDVVLNQQGTWKLPSTLGRKTKAGLYGRTHGPWSTRIWNLTAVDSETRKCPFPAFCPARRLQLAALLNLVPWSWLNVDTASIRACASQRDGPLLRLTGPTARIFFVVADCKLPASTVTHGLYLIDWRDLSPYQGRGSPVSWSVVFPERSRTIS
ncbi:hypothetical protein BDW67DRAFT_167224 [Aspergillus spinulosporus]